jgi:hypothetical protein
MMWGDWLWFILFVIGENFKVGFQAGEVLAGRATK